MPARKKPDRALTPPANRNLSMAETVVYLGVPEKTFDDWRKNRQVPLPRDFNSRDLYYPIRVVKAMKFLIDCGFLPIPQAETEKPSGR